MRPVAMRVKPKDTTSAFRRCLALIACALVVGSCGKGGVDLRAAEEIGGTYELLAAAVDAGDRGQARRTLQDLIGAVEELREAGELDADRAAEILDAAADVSRALRSLPAPTVSTEPSPTVESSEPLDVEEDGEGHGRGPARGEGDAPGNSGGKGNGKAHGHDKD